MYEDNMNVSGHAASTSRPPGEKVLEVEALQRSFGAVKVVSRFDAVLTPGTRLGLHGPNGSGKSTILKCLSGTLMPSAGMARVLGHQAGSFAARLYTGPSLSQERSFYRRLTGFENLLFFARLRHSSKKKAVEQVRAIEAELQLEEILPRRVDRCSTGMVQQISFARALLGSPRLLLLDEPTRSLDDGAIERIWRAIEERDHVAIVIASHIEADLEHCDRVHELPT